MSLVVVGISHHTCPVEIREKLGFTPDSLPRALMHLNSQFDGGGAIVLNTCNRVEIYLNHPFDGYELARQLKTFLSEWHNVPETEVQSVHELATARHPVGWEVSVSYSHGTRAQPVLLRDPLAYDYDEFGPIPKEPVWTDTPVADIVDRTRLDFSAWNAWRSKIEVHKSW